MINKDLDILSLINRFNFLPTKVDERDLIQSYYTNINIDNEICQGNITCSTRPLSYVEQILNKAYKLAEIYLINQLDQAAVKSKLGKVKICDYDDNLDIHHWISYLSIFFLDIISYSNTVQCLTKDIFDQFKDKYGIDCILDNVGCDSANKAKLMNQIWKVFFENIPFCDDKLEMYWGTDYFCVCTDNAPSIITIGNSIPTYRTLEVNWSDENNDLLYVVEVYNNDTNELVQTVNTSYKNLLIENLQPDTEYKIVIKTANCAGNVESEVVLGTLPIYVTVNLIDNRNNTTVTHLLSKEGRHQIDEGVPFSVDFSLNNLLQSPLENNTCLSYFTKVEISDTLNSNIVLLKSPTGPVSQTADHLGLFTGGNVTISPVIDTVIDIYLDEICFSFTDGECQLPNTRIRHSLHFTFGQNDPNVHEAIVYQAEYDTSNKAIFWRSTTLANNDLYFKVGAGSYNAFDSSWDSIPYMNYSQFSSYEIKENDYVRIEYRGPNPNVTDVVGYMEHIIFATPITTKTVQFPINADSAANDFMFWTGLEMTFNSMTSSGGTINVYSEKRSLQELVNSSNLTSFESGLTEANSSGTESNREFVSHLYAERTNILEPLISLTLTQIEDIDVEIGNPGTSLGNFAHPVTRDGTNTQSYRFDGVDDFGRLDDVTAFDYADPYIATPNVNFVRYTFKIRFESVTQRYFDIIYDINSAFSNTYKQNRILFATFGTTISFNIQRFGVNFAANYSANFVAGLNYTIDVFMPIITDINESLDSYSSRVKFFVNNRLANRFNFGGRATIGARGSAGLKTISFGSNGYNPILFAATRIKDIKIERVSNIDFTSVRERYLGLDDTPTYKYDFGRIGELVPNQVPAIGLGNAVDMVDCNNTPSDFFV